MEHMGYTGLDTGICGLGHRRERERKEGRGERGRRRKEGRERGRKGVMISLLETKGNSELFTVFLKVPSSQLPYHLSDTIVLSNLSAGEGGGGGGGKEEEGRRRRRRRGGGGGEEEKEEKGRRRGGEGGGKGGRRNKGPHNSYQSAICCKQLLKETDCPKSQHAVHTFTR